MGGRTGNGKQNQGVSGRTQRHRRNGRLIREVHCPPAGSKKNNPGGAGRMNGLQIFNYNGKEVRTVQLDGEPWWVLKDVCDILGLRNPSRVAERLDGDERSNFELGRQGEAIIINEAGLYRVILRSDKPEAKPFQKWVTNEVLPSIRKHGAYMTPETLRQAVLNPDTLIHIATALKEEQDKNKQLQAVNSALQTDVQIMKPKSDYFDELVERNLLTSFRETAKELGVGEKAFVRFLLDKKYLYRDKRGKLQPYADKNSGLFEVKETYNEKTNWSGTQTLVTPRGRETFRLLVLNAG